MRITCLHLFLLLVVAVGVIFFQFAAIPANISWDELQFAQLALSLKSSDYQVYSGLATGHATLYFYILLASLKIFGVTIWALRLPSALLGVVDILLLYAILRLVFKNPWYALTGGLLMITTRWYITFARFSFEPTFLLFLELCSVLFFLLYWKKKNRVFVWISAFFTGLAFHSYYPGRIFWIVPFSYLAITKQWKLAAGFVGVAALVAFPLIMYLSFSQDTRIEQVSVFAEAKSPVNVIPLIGQNIVKTVGMFLWEGDGNGRHNFPGKPALNPSQMLFFAVGLVLLIIHRKNKIHLLFLSWLVVGIAPTLFTVTNENPNMLRTVTILPAIMYCMLVCIERIFLFTPKKTHIVIGTLVGLLLVASQAYDLRTYFAFQSRVSRNSFEIICSLEENISFKAKTLGEIPTRCRVTENLF